MLPSYGCFILSGFISRDFVFAILILHEAKQDITQKVK